MKRASDGFTKNGTITRAAARSAVLAVKAKRAASGAKGFNSNSNKPSATLIERYLGHFGVDGPSLGMTKSASKKLTPRKKGVKKAVLKNLRRAS